MTVSKWFFTAAISAALLVAAAPAALAVGCAYRHGATFHSITVAATADRGKA